MTKRRISPDNPYPIGTLVLVRAKTEMEYDNEHNRGPVRTSFDPPRPMTICGAVRRQLGRYRRGYHGSTEHGEYDAEPPTLQISGTVFLYQLRSSLTSRPIDAAPDDLDPFPTPDISGPIAGKTDSCRIIDDPIPLTPARSTYRSNAQSPPATAPPTESLRQELRDFPTSGTDDHQPVRLPQDSLDPAVPTIPDPPSAKEAARLGNDPDAVLAELKSTKTLLVHDLRTGFGRGRYNPVARTLTGDNGTVLQWRLRRWPDRPPSYDNQQTNRGVVVILQPDDPFLTPPDDGDT